jgi:KaiC/GvpD/RAD55 family RecA-like ATPase
MTADAARTARDSHVWQTGHDVELYADDGRLVDVASKFLVDGVKAGQPIVVIATPAHRTAFAARMRSMGVNVDDLVDGRDRLWLDANECLAAFMEGSRPNAELFHATIGNVFNRLTLNRDYLVVRAYGEMVDILWKAGKAAAAVEVETLWNELATKHSFWLLCAYANDSILADASHEHVHGMLAQHRHARSTEPEILATLPVALHSAVQIAPA